MPLKCYERARKDGTPYTTCNKDAQKNQPVKKKPKVSKLGVPVKRKPPSKPPPKPKPVFKLAEPRKIGAVARPPRSRRPGAPHSGALGGLTESKYKSTVKHTLPQKGPTSIKMTRKPPTSTMKIAKPSPSAPPKREVKGKPGKLRIDNDKYITKEKFISEIESQGYKFTSSQSKFIDRFIGSSIKIRKYLRGNTNYQVEADSNDTGLFKDEWKKMRADGKLRISLKKIPPKTEVAKKVAKYEALNRKSP